MSLSDITPTTRKPVAAFNTESVYLDAVNPSDAYTLMSEFVRVSRCAPSTLTQVAADTDNNRMTNMIAWMQAAVASHPTALAPTLFVEYSPYVTNPAYSALFTLPEDEKPAIDDTTYDAAELAYIQVACDAYNANLNAANTAAGTTYGVSYIWLDDEVYHNATVNAPGPYTQAQINVREVRKCAIYDVLKANFPSAQITWVGMGANTASNSSLNPNQITHTRGNYCPVGWTVYPIEETPASVKHDLLSSVCFAPLTPDTNQDSIDYTKTVDDGDMVVMYSLGAGYPLPSGVFAVITYDDSVDFNNGVQARDDDRIVMAMFYPELFSSDVALAVWEAKLEQFFRGFHKKTLSIDAATLTITGQTFNLVVPGRFQLDGVRIRIRAQTVNLRVSRRLEVEVGSLTVGGQALAMSMSSNANASGGESAQRPRRRRPGDWPLNQFAPHVGRGGGMTVPFH